MVASGLPRHREDHAETAADMALAMRAAVEDLRLPLQIRIGLHSGAVVAGIIGRRKFSYDLWGDTVNTASRLESHGVPGEIQVSEQTWTRLRARYRLRSRGEIELKGKGAVAVYFLDGRNESDG
jgi:class 3 adenylate cyclase